MQIGARFIARSGHFQAMACSAEHFELRGGAHRRRP
jgi:hypothetical protein